MKNESTLPIWTATCKGVYGNTPLHLAVQIGKVGNTPLHLAVQIDSYFIILSLLGLKFTSLALLQSFSSNGRPFYLFTT